MKKTLWVALGLVLGAVGILGGQFILNELANAPSDSEWVIPYTGFGDYEVERSTLTNEEIYGDQPTPAFLEDISYYDYIIYGDNYIVEHYTAENVYYGDQTFYFEQQKLSIFSSTGVNLWTYAFEFSEGYKIGTLVNDEGRLNIQHMALEGDTLFLIIQFRNFTTYFDPVLLQELTVYNEGGFDVLGGGDNAKQFIQSMVRVNLDTKIFSAVGVNESDVDVFDAEDFERIEPYRYALAQEFDNDDDQAFTHVYYGETLTFTEQTESIALLSEVIFHPTQLSVTVRPIGQWSATYRIDIDLDSTFNTQGEYVPIHESGYMELYVTMEMENVEGKADLTNNLFTADDPYLTTTQQNFIDGAAARYAQDENIERLEYHIIGILDKDFNKVSIETYEEIEYTTSNNPNLEVYMYWVKDNQFVFIISEEVFNDDGLRVSANSIIQFKTNNTVTKSFDFESYGNVFIRDFYMDDNGKMILGGEFVSSDTNPIQDYERSIVLMMNASFQILDEFLIDGEGSSTYLYIFFIDENQLRIFVGIDGQTGMFEGLDLNTWDVIITLQLTE